TGGKSLAGTGTMSDTGEVGAIGGVRQKVLAAEDIGADYFLAPDANCAEALSGPTPGIPVYAVSTLDEALEIIEYEATATADSSLPEGLRTCADALAANVPQV